MKNTKIIYQILKSKRTFASYPKLMMEDDLLARIDKLKAELETKNTIAKEGESSLNEVKANLGSITDKLLTLGKKSRRERRDMTTYLEHFTKFMDKSDITKAEELLSKNKKTEELFNKKNYRGSGIR